MSSTMAVIKACTEALKNAKIALLATVELRAANLKNIESAKEIKKIVDDSVLFKTI